MPKEISKKFCLNNNRSEPRFAPLICSFAAKLQQISVKNMLTNSTKLANSLLNAQKLFGYDAIFCIVDATLEAEACGCDIIWETEDEMPRVGSHPLGEGRGLSQPPLSDIEGRGRIPVVIEATKRLKMVMGNRVDIIGVLTGPLTLSGHLYGDLFVDRLKNDFSEVYEVVRYANTIAIRLCKAYCERKVDGILIYDRMISELPPELLKVVRPFYRTLINVANYYNVYVLIFAGLPSPETISYLFEFDANGIIISGKTDIDHLADMAGEKGKCLGWGVPNAVLSGSIELLRTTLLTAVPKRRKGLFLTTDGPVPYDTPVENLHELMNLF